MNVLSSIMMLIITYFLGSVPFGYLIAKGVKGIDIREHGSGNIGTANAIRALGVFWGSMVFAGDVVKGLIPVLIAKYLLTPSSNGYENWFVCLVGLLSIVGHNYSCFLGFKGGKGIATSFGVFLGLDYQSALLAFAVWGVVLFITKIASLGSLTGATSLPVFLFLFNNPLPSVLFGVVATVFAFYKHRDNIKRLLRGEERKITDKAEKVEENKAETHSDKENKSEEP